ncbi:hypothetical protein [Haloglomus litoreum]|uniref:hypothetical protein n=1 Tax=Haloglomus litoreum TaxID=3034026 RepID=UPI0023E81550|nr:hypothetical protein [Haloglomus sp. DT116]
MRPSLIELLPELLELVLSSLAAALLSVLGLYIEYFAAMTVQGGGDATVGYWAVVPGLVCLGFAYALTVDKVLPGVSGLRTALGERA